MLLGRHFRTVLVALVLGLCLLAVLRGGSSKSKEDLERDKMKAECESKKGCPFRNPKSHAEWVFLTADGTSAADPADEDAAAAPAPAIAADKKAQPVFAAPDLPATKGRLLLYGILAADTEVLMVDHLLQHYLRLGVNPRHVLLVLSDESRALVSEEARAASPLLALLRKRGLGGYYYWPGVWSNSNMAIVRERHLKELRRSGRLVDADWILELDGDELQVFPGAQGDLPGFLGRCDAAGINTLFGVSLHAAGTSAPLGSTSQSAGQGRRQVVALGYLARRRERTPYAPPRQHPHPPRTAHAPPPPLPRYAHPAP